MITKPNRDLCIMACIFCREPAFFKWMAHWVDAWSEKDDPAPAKIAFNEAGAKAFITTLCGVASRNDLDRDPAAAERFHELVRIPYLAWREGGAQ